MKTRHVEAQTVMDGPGRQSALTDLPNCVSQHNDLKEMGFTSCSTCEIDLKSIDFTKQVGFGYFAGD